MKKANQVIRPQMNADYIEKALWLISLQSLIFLYLRFSAFIRGQYLSFAFLPLDHRYPRYRLDIVDSVGKNRQVAILQA
jgi:hypothetical protein